MNLQPEYSLKKHSGISGRLSATLKIESCDSLVSNKVDLVGH